MDDLGDDTLCDMGESTSEVGESSAGFPNTLLRVGTHFPTFIRVLSCSKPRGNILILEVRSIDVCCLSSAIVTHLLDGKDLAIRSSINRHTFAGIIVFLSEDVPI